MLCVGGVRGNFVKGVGGDVEKFGRKCGGRCVGVKGKVRGSWGSVRISVGKCVGVWGQVRGDVGKGMGEI